LHIGKNELASDALRAICTTVGFCGALLCAVCGCKQQRRLRLKHRER
jgi:hypothetical protein